MKNYTHFILLIVAMVLIPLKAICASEHTVKVGEMVKLEIPSSTRSTLSRSTGKSGKWDVNKLELELVSYSWDYAYVRGLKETSLSVVQLTISHNHDGIYGDKYYVPFHVKVIGNNSGGNTGGGAGGGTGGSTTPSLQSIDIPSSLQLEVNQYHQLTPTLTPANANPKLTWTSSDETVATAYNGFVVAKKVGATIVRVTADNGMSDYCIVSVTNPTPQVIIVPSTKEMEVGQSVTLTPTIYPSNAVTTLTWSSSDNKVAIVYGGRVSALAPGTALITVKTSNNLSALCFVTVTESSTSIGEMITEDTDNHITVFTLDGNVLYQGLKTECSKLPQGFYIIKDSTGTKKIVIRE